MKRRSFISSAALATAGVAASCNAPGPAHPVSDKPPHTDQFELAELSISDLQTKMSEGKYTSERITQLYLDRIQVIDKSGPRLNSVIELNPDAISIARQMDAERKSGKTRGLLHGIPVLIKDNIDTADKMQTTAGSLAMSGHVAKKDAFIITKLREAGAVILGKTNLSEWANFRSTRSCSGWSSRGGQTKNPYILDHNPCGSSSGSGVAVAANLCCIAIGTETDGSITCPASTNGIVGIKPTIGFASRSGIIPISSTQDTAGPMGRTVADVATALGFLSGEDPEDLSTGLSGNNVEADYRKFLDAESLKGKRIGVEKKQQGNNHFMHALQEKAVSVLRQKGATIIEIEYLEQINEANDAEFELMKFEFKEGLNKYLSTAQAPVKSLKEVIAFNLKNEDRAMPYFKQEILESAEASTGTDSEEYKAVFEKSHVRSKKIIDDALSQNQLDAICGLTMGPACSIDSIYGDRWGEVFLTMPAAVTGYPHISVPAGMIYSLPVGLSFFGAPFSEGKLISIAFAYEQASKNRQPPGFRPSFFE